MKKPSGFSLAELIIVLAMIGVLRIIVAPVYKSRAVKNKALKIDAYKESQTLGIYSEETSEDNIQEQIQQEASLKQD
ncbi:MAG: prepilin-type N-terminal cleavage/methylation domain-containing protein [Endomicrobium sp.]|jgi:prepilin-type N-terminal cleavage/methylation domain-containing protein|nr:prepilin-type N-terminal cleavage/methylation domain-containing protein [Endomicrobium sp.]